VLYKNLGCGKESDTHLGPQQPQIEAQLEQTGQLGILSVSVLQREGYALQDGWEDYELTLKEISVFLAEYLEQRMRGGDLLLAPIIAGNTFLIFLSPPRRERALDLIDITRVRHRISRSLNQRLMRRLRHAAVQRFGVYVGGALARHDAAVPASRVIYRGVDSAFADAIGQKRVEGQRHAVHLKRILHSGMLGTVYQPVVDMAAQTVIGYEALTRVPGAHFPTPDLLFKAAHENGALWKLERLSRRKALENLPPIADQQLLFLNVEPDALHDPELSSSKFVEQLARVGLRPEQVVLEMTEHVAVKDFAALREVLARCRGLGLRLAMDDVGSGYAGLQAIAEIGPDYLKADMALVRDLDRHPLKRELITTIRRFTDNTGSTLVAEGV